MKSWWGWLLAGLLALQGWALNRQIGAVKQRVDGVESRFGEFRMQAAEQLYRLESQVASRAGLPEWLGRPETAVVADPACLNHRLEVRFSLTEWTSGTRARLQFRRAPGEEWQEAKANEQGAQSYVATIPVAGGTGLLWRVMVSAPPSAGGPRTIYWPPEASQFRSGQTAMPAVQYRIVADAPGVSRASEPQVLPLGEDLVAQAGFTVGVGVNRAYTVTAAGWRFGACTGVREVVARAFAGDRPAGEHPLAPEEGRLAVRWTSDVDLTRIDLVVRYGPHESVVPVELAR